MKTEIEYNGLKFVPYIFGEKIQKRVKEIAREITREYLGKKPLVICVLNGAFPFASDLFRNIDTDAEIAFVRFKSYSGTQTTGAVKEMLGLSEDIEGRHVIVVEDIIDTGHTMYKMLRDLDMHKPASLKVATLLFKPEALVRPVVPDYVGFEIPKKFIIGYGLDIDGLARNLPDIYVLKD